MECKAIRIHATGGIDALCWETVQLPPPGDNDVLVRTVAAGVNFIDIYHRTGLYPLPLPATLGLEGAGVVEAVGGKVTDVQVGDAVGYCVGGVGAYATHRLLDASRTIPLPREISHQQAAAVLLKGMTAEYLIRRTYPVQAGDTVLFHAAAGGVGLIACQWLKILGATVIGTVGSPEKAELAKAHGCAHTILYREEDIAKRVLDITDGKGVPVVYDSVGQATFAASLACLARRGMLVSFGNASGPVAPFSPGLLAEKGSLFLTRPTLMSYCATPEEMLDSANALFLRFIPGCKLIFNQTFALQDAASAHAALESRQTTGSTILISETDGRN